MITHVTTTTYTCDRCKVSTEFNSLHPIYIKDLRNANYASASGVAPIGDLCAKCSDELYEFLGDTFYINKEKLRRTLY